MGNNIEVLVAHGLDVQIVLRMCQILWNMYQIVFRMYLGFQYPFQDGEQPLIHFWGSPKEYINHENGDKGLGSSKNGYT